MPLKTIPVDEVEFESFQWEGWIPLVRATWNGITCIERYPAAALMKLQTIWVELNSPFSILNKIEKQKGQKK